MRIHGYMSMLFSPQLTKHWEDDCIECEMTCPLNKLGGCNFKVCVCVCMYVEGAGVLLCDTDIDSVMQSSSCYSPSPRALVIYVKVL